MDTQVFQIMDHELDNGVTPTIMAFRQAWNARGLTPDIGTVFSMNGLG